jgi:hypothetical protein
VIRSENFFRREDSKMKRISLISLLMLAFALSTLAACGGGGGGGGGFINIQPATPQTTTAVLTLSTAVTGTIPGNTTINGYDVTITLPDGVTVKATPDSLNPAKLVTDPGVVTDIPVGSNAESVYSAATSTLSGTVKVHIASATGYAPGDFCKVNADIAAGHHLTASSFVQPTLDDVAGYDIISKSTVTTLANQLHLTATVVIQ